MAQFTRSSPMVTTFIRMSRAISQIKDSNFKLLLKHAHNSLNILLQKAVRLTDSAFYAFCPRNCTKLARNEKTQLPT